MGWIKDAKADILRQEAERAVQQGGTIFAAMLNTPMNTALSVGSSPGMGPRSSRLCRTAPVKLPGEKPLAGVRPVL